MNDFKETLSLAEEIYYNPELGFKEFKTSKLIENFIKKYFPQEKITKFSETGIKFNLGEKKSLHIALIAEMDAVYTPSHFYANKETGAAHNCGHYSQVAIMLDLLKRLSTDNEYKSFDFSLGFVFTPAEEYLDLEFRKKMKENNRITYLGGKPEAIKLGIFNEFDFAIAIHSMGGGPTRRSIELNCNLAGFLYKYYTFLGKPAHAGFAPQAGINAYSISTLFNTALGLFRQQIDEKYMVRINPVILDAPMGTNVIPDKIKIGTDIRAHSVEYMLELSERLDTIAQCSAKALGGDVKIETEMGYLPFLQSHYLSNFVRETFKNFPEIEYCKENSPVSAAGDIGDLSYILPCIQIGYNGFSGTFHGTDFIHKDNEYIFSIFPKFLMKVLKDMSGKIDKSKLYKKTYEDYKKIIEKLGGENEK